MNKSIIWSVQQELRKKCIKNNWYTKGTNEEYENMFSMLENDIPLVDVATDILNHSVIENAISVENILLAIETIVEKFETLINKTKEDKKMNTINNLIITNTTGKALSKQQFTEAGMIDAEITGYALNIETLRIAMDKAEKTNGKKDKQAAYEAIKKAYTVVGLEYTYIPAEYVHIAKLVHNWGTLSNVKHNGEIVKQRSITDENHVTEYGFNAKSKATFRKHFEQFVAARINGTITVTESEIADIKAKIIAEKKAEKVAEKAKTAIKPETKTAEKAKAPTKKSKKSKTEKSDKAA